MLFRSAGTSGPAREFLADRAESDVDDPDLGAAALEDDAEGGGGPRLRASLEDWPDDDEEVGPGPGQEPAILVRALLPRRVLRAAG